MRKVLVLYRTLPQYRVEFYDLLKDELQTKGVELQLIYGDTHFDSRRDTAHISWGTFRRNKVFKAGPIELIWQPCLKEVRSVDLVIVEQANKLLINYYLIIQKIFSKKKVAFWGHGLDLQAPKKSAANRFKRIFINKPSWWFAYTEGVKNFLIDSGFEKDKITVVQNAINTRKMCEDFNAITNEEAMALKNKLGINEDEKVFIYCGALVPYKRIDFLLDAADELAKINYKFKFIVIGSGPMEQLITSASETRPWLIFEGPKFGREKCVYFKFTDIFLHPGAMGLAILDSFAFKTPLITAKDEFHGPEIEYIENGYNGFVTENDLNAYVNTVASLLDDPKKICTIKNNCSNLVNK